MPILELSQLSAELQAALRSELALKPDSSLTLTWDQPRESWRVLIEVFRHGPDGRMLPVRRYLENHTRSHFEACELAAMSTVGNMSAQAVNAEEAHARLQALEDADPSQEYLRIGRIWDLALEPSAARRIPEQRPSLAAPVPATVPW